MLGIFVIILGVVVLILGIRGTYQNFLGPVKKSGIDSSDFKIVG